MALTLHGLIKTVNEERRGAGDDCKEKRKSTEGAKLIVNVQKREDEKAGVCVNAGRN